MRISYNWLKELGDIGLSASVLAERLTMIGLAVDSVDRAGDDYIYDFDLLSNRPDTLSHRGICREAALVCGTKLKIPSVKVPETDEPAQRAISIEILDPDLCPRYAARVIRGVKVGPSPKWLATRLESIGQRSVNNVADVTNYVMFEMGQPTHAFDLGRIRGRRIVVRRGRPGEQITTLDGLTRNLSTEMLVIADAERPIALAGIMGGEDSEISAATQDVLLESAYFKPASVRQAARALGLDTEASYRFERGADYEAQVWAADLAAGMIADMAGGRVLKGAVDVRPVSMKPEPVRLRESRIRDLTGLDVEIGRAAGILRALEFAVEEREGRRELVAVAPSFRVDIRREVDLVEEVARHVGYGLIELTLPAWAGSGSYHAGESGRRKIRQTLTSLGFDEAISLSFVNGERDRLFGESERAGMKLANPIDAGEDAMRTSLLTGLVAALQRNFRQGRRDVRLFELGRVFLRSLDELPQESALLGLVMSGTTSPNGWRGNRELDFYDLKGAVEAVLESAGVAGFTIERASVEYLHPGQSASLVRDGLRLARFGRLAPGTALLYKFRQPVFVAEIELDNMLKLAGDRVRYSALPRLPAASRDVSCEVPENVSWGEIEKGIASLNVKEIASVSVFDVYKGPGVAEGMRSLAFRVTYRGDGRTLTDDEVAGMDGRVREMLQLRFQAVLR